MKILIKILILSTSLIILIACDYIRVFDDGNVTDKLVKEDLVEKHGISIMAQVYTIRSYDDQRMLMYWCKSKNTIDVLTATNYYGVGTVKNSDFGWRPFAIGRVYNLKNKESIVKNENVNYIQIVDQKFVYINSGNLSLKVSFDACKSIESLFLNISDSNSSSRLFKNNELKREQGLVVDGYGSASFSGHTQQTVGFIERYCFNINQVWVVDSNNHYQVCTEDKGKNWYATRKIGDGKVMKRLAGSEEWVSHE